MNTEIDYTAKQVKVSEEAHDKLAEVKQEMCPTRHTPFSVVVRRLAENYLESEEQNDD